MAIYGEPKTPSAGLLLLTSKWPFRMADLGGVPYWGQTRSGL
jgi:hypothetical protein